MRKKIDLLLLLLFVSTALFGRDGKQPIGLRELTDGTFRQAYIPEMRSDPDGEHYTAMDADRRRIIRYSYRTGKAVDTLFDAKRARECTFDTFDGYAINSTGHRILVWRKTERIYRHSFRAETFDYDVRRNLIKPLTESGGKVMIPTFSPDGRMCAFVKDGNIWLKKFDYDSEVQVTTDGAVNRIINGATDWVYEEEFGTTNLMAWAPDNSCLAYVRFDESEVLEYSMQTYDTGNAYPGYYRYKYPKAGEKNSTVTLHAYQIDTKDTRTLNVPIGADGYIPRIDFAATADQLAVMTLNRHQNLFGLYFVNPKSGVARLILKDENKCYIDADALKSLRFTKNGFFYISEKDGYAHIYQHALTGVEQRQVTRGNWDVTALLGIDESTNTIYYESAEESPLRRAVYKVDAKGTKTRLTPQPGTHRATFSANCAYFVDRYSTAATPTVATVVEARTGKTLRTLEDNNALRQKMAAYDFRPKEFITLETASGHTLNAWIVKPADFDESRRYPVVMYQYSGPNSQSVLDDFRVDWEQHLASIGYIYVCVDGRGTGARGEEFRKCTYLRMGELEAADQVAAAHALSRLPYVDSKRIAIWGWSFGGYNTLMALSTGNGTFKAGIAVAPPTDWRFYDTVYTERYMRTPNENQRGYDATSPLKKVADMQGRLLLIHGTADDNVHVKQTMDYAEALVQAGKQFDMQLYRDRDHGIYGGQTRLHLYTRMTNFLQNNL